jgi:hypothetical protein
LIDPHDLMNELHRAKGSNEFYHVHHCMCDAEICYECLDTICKSRDDSEEEDENAKAQV